MLASLTSLTLEGDPDVNFQTLPVSLTQKIPSTISIPQKTGRKSYVINRDFVCHPTGSLQVCRDPWDSLKNVSL